MSAAMGYLDAETRKRSNLTISTDTQVKSLLFEGTQLRRRHGHGRRPGDRSSAPAK